MPRIALFLLFLLSVGRGPAALGQDPARRRPRRRPSRHGKAGAAKSARPAASAVAGPGVSAGGPAARGDAAEHENQAGPGHTDQDFPSPLRQTAELDDLASNRLVQKRANEVVARYADRSTGLQEQYEAVLAFLNKSSAGVRPTGRRTRSSAMRTAAKFAELMDNNHVNPEAIQAFLDRVDADIALDEAAPKCWRSRPG